MRNRKIDIWIKLAIILIIIVLGRFLYCVSNGEWKKEILQTISIITSATVTIYLRCKKEKQ